MSMKEGPAIQGSGRRFDPERRDRIIDAALDVIAERGVAGTTHRRVAEAADVPLGSMTYHFSGMDDLLFAAFKRFATNIADIYCRRLRAAADIDEARETVVDLACGNGWTSPQTVAQIHELYAYSVRNPGLRSIWKKWMADSRAALERHFPPKTARALDAAIEGIVIHNSLEPGSLSRDEVADMVERLSR